MAGGWTTFSLVRSPLRDAKGLSRMFHVDDQIQVSEILEVFTSTLDWLVAKNVVVDDL